MTDRLYYTDAYLAAFDARVVDVGDDGRRVRLDRTAFYPTSGGQPFDVGTIAGARVVDVVDEGDAVAHLLDVPLADAAPGAAVRGEIDWARRFDHMQQHTGQHLLSAVFADLFGHATVSVHFGAEYSTLDLDVESVPRERLLAAEERANEIVVENRPVLISFEDAATATGLRKAVDRAGTLRIVSIDGVDRSACGGTHVRSTGEIGPVLIGRQERVRKSTRVEFLCGWRVLRRARRDREMLAAMAATLSASIEETPALVASMSEQLRASEAARRRLEGELATFQARERHAALAPGARGVRLLVERRDAGTLDEVRPLAQAFAQLPMAAAIVVIERPATILLAVSDDAGLDAGALLREALREVGGRGGGSPRSAQGTAPSAEAIARVAERLSAEIAP